MTEREARARAIRKAVYLDGCSVPYEREDLQPWAEADPPCPVCLAVERGALAALSPATPKAPRVRPAFNIEDVIEIDEDGKVHYPAPAPCARCAAVAEEADELARDVRGDAADEPER